MVGGGSAAPGGKGLGPLDFGTANLIVEVAPNECAEATLPVKRRRATP
jgi:hypothetical protein